MRSGRPKQITTSFGPDGTTQTSLMHSQLWVPFILPGYWPFTAQPWVPEILVFALLLYASVSLLYPGCYCAPAITRYWALFAALLLYDYTLTIAREIELFWNRPKRSRMFALFIANRYITILGHAPSLVYSFWSPETKSDYRVSSVSHYLSRILTCNRLFWH